jgi:hypothetical protein
MLKYAHAQIMTKALAPQDASARELRRFAHRHHFDYEVRPGFLYVRSRAISSRCNDNFDEFPAEELEKGYRTFLGKPVFVNHHNDDHKRARGVIIDAALHKDSNRDGSPDWWIEVLHEVDALRFPKLAQEILNGNIARTSMGCDVAFSVCSACGNKATTPAEYCAHIPASKGMTLYRTTAAGHKVGEIIRETCYGLKFFENSLLVEPPADPTAYFLGVDDRGLKTQAAVTAARGLSWDEVGERHPAIYGQPEFHAAAPEDADGEMIGWAANDLAHSTPDDPDGDEHSVDELTFHHAMVSPHTIDHKRHEPGDYRVQHAAEGYRDHPEQMPPVVLVHRHGVYQVADGHHRAEAAKVAGMKKIHAYVAKSPFPDTPSGWGESAPYHGAKKTTFPVKPGKDPGTVPEGSGYAQDRLFEAAKSTYTNPYASDDKTAAKDPRFAEVGLKQDDDGHYVTTHRARSKSYPTPQDIPQSEVDRIAATGAAKEPYGNVNYADPGYQDDKKKRYPIDTEEHIRAAWSYINHPDNASKYQGGHLDSIKKKIKGAAEEHGIQIESRLTLSELMAEGINQEGGELPAFPWDKAPKINLPMTQKGWDDPRRKDVYDAMGERDLKGPQPAGPYQGLIDKLPDYATQKMTNPHDIDADTAGRSAITPDKYPGDKKEQWARHRWDNVKWPSWTDHNERPSTPTEIANSKQNIRNRWSKTWKRPLACDHPGCPPWEHEGDPTRPTTPKPSGASGITMSNGHPLDPFEEFLGNDEGTSKEGAAATPPEDHPWFKETGISHHNIVDHWDQSTPEEKAQGKRWYPDAHLVAKSIARLDPRIKTEKEAAHKGGGVLSAYSPQQGWWANQHNAARAFHEQRAVGKGEGIMVMSSHANAAQRILDGEDSQKVLKGPKTADFAHLIEHGGHKPQSDEDAAAGKPREHSDKVVVDRHALSVAAGRRLNADDVKGFPSQSRKHYEVVANHYRKAAAVISDREGREVPPHEVQAVTWLTRQRLNAEGDTSPGQKGRNTVQRNQRQKWQELSRMHNPDLHEAEPPNSHVSRKLAFGEQKAPVDVDTLREDACPVCGDRDTFDGATCQVCGYVAPPKMFQDPDLEKARQMDLRKDIADFQDPNQLGPDGQPMNPQEQVGPADPSALDENGNPINPDAADPNAQPGSLPGEVQAEVQPGDPAGVPGDPSQLGPDGQPVEQPNELGAPVDPAMLGPDGQPLQQPGQQMMVGPDGMPIGPQALPPGATTSDGQPFTPGPNMPQGPGGPESPEEPAGPQDLDEDGQIPNPDAGQGVPGTPGDGVPDLQCPACGFTVDASPPVPVDMDTSVMPPTGDTSDGVQAGDICPNCGAGQLISPAEGQGDVPLPV